MAPSKNKNISLITDFINYATLVPVEGLSGTSLSVKQHKGIDITKSPNWYTGMITKVTVRLVSLLQWTYGQAVVYTWQESLVDFWWSSLSIVIFLTFTWTHVLYPSNFLEFVRHQKKLAGAAVSIVVLSKRMLFYQRSRQVKPGQTKIPRQLQTQPAMGCTF